MQPLTVHIMTAALTTGDAIGNYILICADILRRWGVRVHLYADYVAPELATQASLTAYYRPTGTAILWFHYSIWSDNITIAQQTNDFVLVDYHGITPPDLLTGNPHIQQLCQQAIEAMPQMTTWADAAIVHSTLTKDELDAVGFTADAIYSIPLAVDLTKFSVIDQRLSALLEQVPYLLFVGRIVPQKDMAALIDLYAIMQKSVPTLRLIIVGSATILPAYKRQLQEQIKRYNLNNHVEWLGQINDPAVLSALYKQAMFYCALSDWESFCVPIAESLYVGTPAVVSDIRPLPDVAGAGGIVVNKRSLETAAQLLVHFYDHPSQYSKLRNHAAAMGKTYTSQALEHNLKTMFSQINNRLNE